MILLLSGSGYDILWAQDYFPEQNKNIAAGVGMVPVAFLLDATMRDFVRSTSSPTSDIVFGISNQMGEPYVTLPLIAGMYLGGLAADNTSLKNTGLYLGEAYALNIAVTFTLKSVLGRARPYNNLGNNEFTFWAFKDAFMSCPSGHSSAAFTTATIVAHQINTPTAYYISYGLSFMTMMSRIYYDKHWFSDTVFGALIGTLSGFIILELNSQDTEEQAPKPGVSSLPVFSISLPIL